MTEPNEGHRTWIRTESIRRAGRRPTAAEGVWATFGLDHSQHWSTTVFPDELAARRYAMENYLTVGFMRYGEPLGSSEAS